MATSLPFEIEGAGPKRERLSGRIRPGVLEILGGMGVGKTHFIAWLLAAAGADVPEEWLEVSYGLDVGRCRLGPNKLEVVLGEPPAASEAGMGAAAEAVEAGETFGRSPLSVLFDPGGKTAGTNRKLRMQAYAQIAGLDPTRERLARICAGNEELLEWSMDQIARRKGKTAIRDLEAGVRMVAQEAHRRKREDHAAKIEAASQRRGELQGAVDELKRQIGEACGIDTSGEAGDQMAEQALLADLGAEPRMATYGFSEAWLERFAVDPAISGADMARGYLARLEAKAEARAEFDERVGALEGSEDVIDLRPAQKALADAEAAQAVERGKASTAAAAQAATSATSNAAFLKLKESGAELDGAKRDEDAANETVRRLRGALTMAERDLSGAQRRRSRDGDIFDLDEAAAGKAQEAEALAVSVVEATATAEQLADAALFAAREDLGKLQGLAAAQGERQRLLTTDPEDIGPDQQTLAEAERQVEQLELETKLYAIRSRFAELAADYQAALEEEEREQKAANLLKDIAAAAPRRMYSILVDEGGTEGVEIDTDGRIWIADEHEGEERKRDIEDTAHVSEGERTCALLDLALPYFRSLAVPVAHLDGKFWRGLGETQRREYGREAAARGLCLLTEQVTDDGDTRPCSVETGELWMMHEEDGVWVAMDAAGVANVPGAGETFASEVYYRILGEAP